MSKEKAADRIIKEANFAFMSGEISEATADLSNMPAFEAWAEKWDSAVAAASLAVLCGILCHDMDWTEDQFDRAILYMARLGREAARLAGGEKE